MYTLRTIHTGNNGMTSIYNQHISDSKYVVFKPDGSGSAFNDFCDEKNLHTIHINEDGIKTKDKIAAVIWNFKEYYPIIAGVEAYIVSKCETEQIIVSNIEAESESKKLTSE